MPAANISPDQVPYLVLLETFLDTVKRSGLYASEGRQNTSQKDLADNLFYVDPALLSRYKKAVDNEEQTALPCAAFSAAIRKFFQDKNQTGAAFDEEALKKDLIDFIDTAGSRIKYIAPRYSMLYFRNLIQEPGDSFYHEGPGWKTAIDDLSRMFYEVSYEGKTFAELEARRDHCRYYRISPEAFDATLEFLRNSEPLPESVKQYFRKMGGEPMQNCIYNTLICKMGDHFDEDKLVQTTAEIFHYQTLLNYRLGRVIFFAEYSPEKDLFLMKNILHEIKYRHFSSLDLDIMNFDPNDPAQPDLEEENNRLFVRKVSELYKTSYRKEPSIKDFSSDQMIQLIEQYSSLYTGHSISNLLEYLKMRSRVPGDPAESGPEAE